MSPSWNHFLSPQLPHPYPEQSFGYVRNRLDEVKQILREDFKGADFLKADRYFEREYVQRWRSQQPDAEPERREFYRLIKMEVSKSVVDTRLYALVSVGVDLEGVLNAYRNGDLDRPFESSEDGGHVLTTRIRTLVQVGEALQSLKLMEMAYASESPELAKQIFISSQESFRFLSKAVNIGAPNAQKAEERTVDAEIHWPPILDSIITRIEQGGERPGLAAINEIEKRFPKLTGDALRRKIETAERKVREERRLRRSNQQ